MGGPPSPRALLAVAVLWLLSLLWVGVLPVVLALIVCSLLYPATRWMSAHGLGYPLSAVLTLILALALITGVVVFIAPDVVKQLRDIGSTALGGLDKLQEWLAGPPFSIGTGSVDDVIDEALSWAQSRGKVIASGAFSGLAAASSALITAALAVVLTFFFLKDGHRFLPWLRPVVGRRVGLHLSEILTHNWLVLGGFIRTQAIVSAVDGFFIGLGLLLLGCHWPWRWLSSRSLPASSRSSGR